MKLFFPLNMDINKQIVYLCKKNIENFDEPIKLKVSITTLNDEQDIIQYGLKNNKYAVIKQPRNDILDSIKAGDRFYFRKELPEIHDSKQFSKDGANYEVSAEPTKTINIIKIELKGLPNK